MKLLKHEKEYWARFYTHDASKCNVQPCPVHNPSKHHMRKWPLNYRMDRCITERICKHGVGHPDPDCSRIGEHGANRQHGCDGCCQLNMANPPQFKRVAKRKTHPDIKGHIAG